jgi:predicted nucleotidyltransferase
VTPDVETKLKAFFADPPVPIAAVYLFGSVARGTDTTESDVDIGVLFQVLPPSTLTGLPLDLEDAIERHLGRRVQLVTLNTAPVDLRWRVLRDGRLIAEPDRVARVRWEVATRNEAFDLEPILREYRSGRKR